VDASIFAFSSRNFLSYGVSNLSLSFRALAIISGNKDFYTEVSNFLVLLSSLRVRLLLLIVITAIIAADIMALLYPVASI
jgi:hypothetical protein